MLALLRGVARCPVYRAHAPLLANREPDDVWFDAEQGWVVTFPLANDVGEALIMFGLRQGSVDAVFEVVAAARVHARDGAVTAERLPLEPEPQRRPRDYHTPENRLASAAMAT